MAISRAIWNLNTSLGEELLHLGSREAGILTGGLVRYDVSENMDAGVHIAIYYLYDFHEVTKHLNLFPLL